MKTIELCESLCRETVEKLGFALWGRDRFDDVELLIRVLTRETWERRAE